MQKNKRRDESVTSLSIGDIALQMDSQFMGFYHNEENKSTILMIDSFFQPFFCKRICGVWTAGWTKTSILKTSLWTRIR